MLVLNPEGNRVGHEKEKFWLERSLIKSARELNFRKAVSKHKDTNPQSSASVASLFRDLIALTAKGSMTKAKPPL